MLSSSTTYEHMDRDDMQRLGAEHQRDLTARRSLANDIDHTRHWLARGAELRDLQQLTADGHTRHWLARGVELLDRLRDRQQLTADGHRRLAKLTGIN
jgi:hypothetical protein